MSDAQHRLAVYGTLGPGCPNHHVLADVAGRWLPGTVRGTLRTRGWGAELGFPGIVLDPSGDEVTVDLLESTDLPDHWRRLDEFEGPGYRRTAVTVSTPEGDLEASIYELAALD
ncbi:MAG: gamma-glutamylcyclotransferase [Actinomycetota bacterium]